MIGILLAQSQVDRLSGLKCYVPSDDRSKAYTELVRVLQLAETSGVAAIVINRWLEDATEWPQPADLRKLVEQENAALRRAENNGVCPFCDGTGFTTVLVGQYSGAKVCECLPSSHHAREDPREHEYWKPHWRFPRTEAY